MPAGLLVAFNATDLTFTFTDDSTGISLTDAIGNIAISSPNGAWYSNSVITYVTGTCQAGSTSSTIRLANAASSSNDFYNDLWVEIMAHGALPLIIRQLIG